MSMNLEHGRQTSVLPNDQIRAEKYPQSIHEHLNELDYLSDPEHRSARASTGSQGLADWVR